MGINAIWKTEFGEELASVDDQKMILSSAILRGIDLSDTVCLRFLDPYGDACFNHIQIPILVKEIEDLLNKTDDPQVGDHLKMVAKLARNAIRVHTYLWFIGD